MKKTEVGDTQKLEPWDRLLEKHAHPDFDQSARTHEAFLRRREGGIPDARTLLQIVFWYSLTPLSFRAVASLAAVKKIADSSNIALRARIRRAQGWLEHLLSVELAKRRPRVDIPLRLTVLIQDATVICVPGSRGTDYRVHLLSDLETQGPADIAITDNKGGESLCRFTFPANTLVLGDQIYATRQGIAAVAKQNAFVLVRANWLNLPLQDEAGKPLKLIELARQCPLDAPLEVMVSTVPAEKANLPAIKGRLIIVRKTPEAAQRARRRLHKESKKKGHTPSEESLEAQDYVFLFTTVDAATLPAPVAVALYRWRWQIEICFKRLKSIVGLDQVRVKDASLVRCVLCAKLLAMLWLDETLAHWEERLLAEVPDPEAVLAPRWRMMQLLWDGLKQVIGCYVTPEELLAASTEVRRHIIEPPRRRTRERNAQLSCIRSHLSTYPLY